ncbi:PARP3 [Symbiodinium sp. CCMP2592]|nr:PARP3 [Symbiodinium sp. CCMP2592]
MCSRYISFVTSTANKTLADYLILFHRCAIADVWLVLIYAIHVFSSVSLMVNNYDEATFLEVILVVLGVSVVFLWLCDAALVTRLRSRVREASSSGVVSPEKVEGVINMKRLCVAVSGLGITVYALRFCVQLWKANESLNTVNSCLLAVLLLTKVLRLLALNSFSDWLRATGQATSARQIEALRTPLER